jgi:surface polysaccharide O-acyltransferase-like enzyme
LLVFRQFYLHVHLRCSSLHSFRNFSYTFFRCQSPTTFLSRSMVPIFFFLRGAFLFGKNVGSREQQLGLRYYLNCFRYSSVPFVNLHFHAI